MAEHKTSLYDLYNRPNDEGKLVTPDGTELIFAEKGSGSKRGKAMLLSSLKSWILPGNGEIDTANIKDNAVTTDKLFGLCVTTQKIANGAVTISKLDANLKRELVTADVEELVAFTENDSMKKIAEITSNTSSRIVDMSVRFQVIGGETSPSGKWDFDVILQSRNTGAQPVVLKTKRVMWSDRDTVEVRMCVSDVYSNSQGSSLKLFVQKTSSGDYWAGSPQYFDILAISVEGVLP